jgi:uncharacterized repeat protein (TIGR02543 family)
MSKNILIIIVTIIFLNSYTVHPTYAINENDYVFDNVLGKIIRYLGNDEIVIIPPTINGVKVKSIGGGRLSDFRGAFSHKYDIQQIIIPDTVEVIDDYAFESCRGLITIFIPSTVRTIGKQAFSDCQNLHSINVSPDNQYYASYDGTLFNKRFTTLLQCPNGKEGNYTVPSTVEKINDRAFIHCSKLTSINISKNVKNIGNGVFGGTDMLQLINVDSNNSNYSSVDGILYDKKLSTIIYYPSGKTDEQFTILDTVKHIKNSCYTGYYLRKIISNAIVAPTASYEAISWAYKIELSLPSGAVGYEQGAWTAFKTITYRGDYTVTFHTQGGNYIEPINGLNSNIILPSIMPVKDGYYFDGWYLDDNYIHPCLFSSFRISSNVDLYAKWSTSPSNITYAIVTFDSNGSASNATTPSISLTIPLETNISYLPVVKWRYPDGTGAINYNFVEWNTKKDGTGEKFTINTHVESDITVYAIWSSPKPSDIPIRKFFGICNVTEDIGEKTVLASIVNDLGISFENIIAICVMYNDDETINEIRKTSVPMLGNNQSYRATFEFNNSDDFRNYKIYIWRSINSLSPICLPYVSQ